MCRNTSPPHTGLQDRDDGSDTESVGSVDGDAYDLSNDGLMRSCVPNSSSVRQSACSLPKGLSELAWTICAALRTPRLQYTFGPPLGGDWKQVPREDPTPIKQTEQEPTAERDAPDTDVKDVTTKKLTFKNPTKPRPKIAKYATASRFSRLWTASRYEASRLDTNLFVCLRVGGTDRHRRKISRTLQIRRRRVATARVPNA